MPKFGNLGKLNCNNVTVTILKLLAVLPEVGDSTGNTIHTVSKPAFAKPLQLQGIHRLNEN